MFLVIMDYSWGGIIKIKLSEEDAQRIVNEGEAYVATLQDVYGFRLSDSYWMTCETLQEANYY